MIDSKPQSRAGALVFAMLAALLPAATAGAQSGLGFDDGAPTAEIKITPEALRLAPGQSALLTVRFGIPDDHHQSRNEELFYVSAAPPDGVAAGDVSYPRGTEEHGETVYRGSVDLELSLTTEADAEPGRYPVPVTAGYQLCADDGTCYFPQSVELIVDLHIEGGESSASIGHAPASGAGRPILLYLLMAFVGGLILNVMPCVLPVLSLKAMNLVSQAGNDARKTLIGSLMYAAGILASFLVLAGLVIALKASGRLVGWGFQFQSPAFVLVLTSLIFVFALSLFDVFVITLPGMSTAARASGAGGHLGSFLTGVFAVILATPCTAPILGTALGFAFTQPAGLIVAIFTLVGLGLSLPFIVLGFYPGFIRLMPKPGKWMNIFKEVMGFLLLGTAVFLLNTLYHQTGGTGLISVLVFLSILAFAAWLFGRFANVGASRPRRTVASIIALVLVVVSAAFVPDIGPSDTATAAEETGTLPDGWEPFSPAAVESYRSAGHPVFIDFHAEWCTTCKVNRTRVLEDPDVVGAFERRGVKRLSADYTSNDETVGEWIRSLGKAGVPVYALFLPGGDRPIVLPELLTKRALLDTLTEHL